MCPVLGIPLELGTRHFHDNAPSIDRIDNEKGYIPGNVWIISHKANRMKKDKPIDEFLSETEKIRLKLEEEPEKVFKLPENFSFKDSINRWRTISLFVDHPLMDKGNMDKFPPLYTLGDHDLEGYYSLKRLYLEMGDPTEYKVATKYLGGWNHWQHLTKANWFMDWLEPIREELEIKLRSEALENIIIDSVSTSKTSKTSARYITEAGYNINTNKRTKAYKEAEKTRTKAVSDRVKADMDRIGLTVVPKN